MQSMEETYREHAKTVYRYLLAQTHDADLAEELTQETFYQAVRTADRFHGGCRITTWLCGIARNVLRTERRRRRAEPLEDSLPSAETADGDLLAEETRAELSQKMRMLSDEAQEVIRLRVYGALSFREIGEILSHTENWARVTYYRAKEKLRKELEYDDEK